MCHVTQSPQQESRRSFDRILQGQSKPILSEVLAREREARGCRRGTPDDPHSGGVCEHGQ